MRLDPVAVGIDDKSRIVAGTVIRAQARLAVVASAVAQCRRVKRLNAARRGGGKDGVIGRRLVDS